MNMVEAILLGAVVAFIIGACVYAVMKTPKGK